MGDVSYIGVVGERSQNPKYKHSNETNAVDGRLETHLVAPPLLCLCGFLIGRGWIDGWDDGSDDVGEGDTCDSVDFPHEARCLRGVVLCGFENIGNISLLLASEIQCFIAFVCRNAGQT